MTPSEQQMQVGVVVCLAPGWDVVRLPAADDRLGREAIAAMDAIMGAMREEHDDAETLTLIERAVRRYMGERWAIQRETDHVTDTYDIRMSQYDHPEAKRGQHTNGPSKIFVRRPDGPWYRVRYHAQYKVRLMIATYGFDHFVATHCTLVAQEPTQ